MKKTFVSKYLTPLIITLTLTVAALSVSCSKEHEFVGVWQATKMQNNYWVIHQFTFKKDGSALYCASIPAIFQDICVRGSFAATDDGKAQACIGNDNQIFNFSKKKKDLYCPELDLHFSLMYR